MPEGDEGDEGENECIDNNNPAKQCVRSVILHSQLLPRQDTVNHRFLL